jgi:hypothetical protein
VSTVTNIPIEHAFPIGSVIRYRHGRREATIVGVDFTYDLVYLLRYNDNGQESALPIRRVDCTFEVVA